jgi:hypothetical protein
MLLLESARKSVFAFRVIEESGENRVEFKRLDSGGNVLTSRTLNFRENAGGMFNDDKCALYTFISATLSGFGNSFRDTFVLVQPVNPDGPEEILQKEQYKTFNSLKASAAAFI